MGKQLPVLKLKKETNLYKLRKESGKTQEEIAKLIGCTAKTYRGYETGEQPPYIGHLITLADYYHVSTDYILDRSSFRTPERDYIGKTTGLSDVAIQHLNAVHEASPKAAEICFLNFLLEGFRLDNLALLFDRFINPTMSITLAEDPASGELTPITEEAYNSKDTIPRKVTIDFNKDAIGLGFTKDMVEQSIFRKLNDLFSEWRDAWKK